MTDAHPASAGSANSETLPYHWVRVLALLIIVFALTWTATRFGSQSSGGVTLIWPVNAVVMVVLLRSPMREWPLLLLSAGIGDYFAGVAPLVQFASGFGLTLCDLLESTVGALALLSLVGRDIELSRRRDMIAFAAVVVVSSTISGLPASLILLQTRGAAVSHTLPLWILGDTLGFLIVAPASLSARSGELKALFSRSKRLRTVAVVGLELAVIAAVSLIDQVSLEPLILAAFILPALELGMTGAAIGILLGSTAVFGFYAASAGTAHIAPDVQVRNAITLQIFIAVNVAATLALAVTLVRRRAAEDALRRSEAELLNNERMLRAILDHMPASVSLWGRDLRNLFINRVRDYYGVSLTGYQGTHLREIIGEEKLATRVPYYEAVFRGETVHFVAADTAPSSKTKYLENTLVPDRRGDEIVGFYAFTVDITERKSAEDALQEKMVLLETAHELAALGSFSIDLPSQTVFLSAEMARLFGAGEAAMSLDVEEYRRRFHFPEDVERSIELGSKAYSSGNSFHFESRIIRADGEVIWAQAHSILLPNGSTVMGMMQDITERKQAEAQLVQTQKTEAIGQLSGGIAHDFNSNT